MDLCDVLIWDKKFGELFYNDNRLLFRYTSKPPFEISPLMLSTEGDVYDYSDLDKQKHLPGVLADSLPDNYGQKAIDRYFGSLAREPDEIDKLLFIGNRTMGAITYSPAANDTAAFEQTMSIHRLYDAVRETINDDHMIDTELGVHILKSVSPVGGAKPKALIGFKDIDSPIYIGPRNSDMPDGYVPSIIKLATEDEGAKPDDLKTEYAYMNLARECGIDIPEISITDASHYIIRRFDRDHGSKLHMHSLQGLLHSDFSVPMTVDYVEAFRIMLRLNCGKKDFELLYRRMIFNYLLRNHDDHEKNVSFLMNRKGAWKLSPAYDLTFAYKPGGRHIGDHQLTFNGKAGNTVTLRDFKEIADTFSIPHAEQIIQLIDEARHTLEDRMKALDISPTHIAKVTNGIFERSFHGK